jgi:hypothetical protein
MQSRQPVDSNVNDIQPLDADTIFVMGHDGNLWLETSTNGNFVSGDQTIKTRTLITTNDIGASVALNKEEVYCTDSGLNLWYAYSPWGPSNRSKVDSNVNGCYSLYSPPSLIGNG